MSNEPGCDRRIHAKIMSRRLREMVDHLRDGIQKVEEPQLKVMLENSAEMLVGLNKVFQNYVHKCEAGGQGGVSFRMFDRLVLLESNPSTEM